MDPLRFCVVALRLGLINRRQFIAAAELWSVTNQPMDQLFLQQHWITKEGVAQILNSDSSDDDRVAPTVVCQVPNDPSKPINRIQKRNRLELQRLHSSGGVGEVWLARDNLLDREVALKRLQASSLRSPIHLQRFFREARITSQLSHPGIVPVYDYKVGDETEPPFYTMRLIHGRTLTEVLCEKHRVGKALPLAPLLELLSYFTSVCGTVSFAHSQGVVHRDLKPGNIIVGNYGEVVTLDWGLAKYLDETKGVIPSSEEYRTVQGTQLGTPAFMAPEQASGDIDEIDCQTDVYGLAAVLYSLLTGRPPFLGDSTAVVLAQVLRDTPVHPREINTASPASLSELCMQGLEKLKADRPPNAEYLRHQVNSWVTEQIEKARARAERERFFDLSSDLLLIVDTAGQVTHANRASEHALSKDTPSLVGALLSDVIDGFPSSPPEVGTALETQVTTGGSSTWVHWRIFAVPGEQSVYLVGRDITTQKQQEIELEMLIERSPDAMCFVALDSSIVRINAQMEGLFGYTREQLVGQRIDVLLPPEVHERHAQHVKKYLENPTVRSMDRGTYLSGLHASGKTLNLEIRLGPIWTAARKLIACTLRQRSN